MRGRARRSVSLAVLALALPLAWSLRSAYDFNQTWLAENKLSDSERQIVAALHALVPAGQTEWLQPPWGENQFFTPAMDAGLKIAGYFRPWRWNGHNSPPPFAEALRLKLWPGDVTYAGDHGRRQPWQYILIVLTRRSARGERGWVPCSAVALGRRH